MQDLVSVEVYRLWAKRGGLGGWSVSPQVTNTKRTWVLPSSCLHSKGDSAFVSALDLLNLNILSSPMVTGYLAMHLLPPRVCLCCHLPLGPLIQFGCGFVSPSPSPISPHSVLTLLPATHGV